MKKIAFILLSLAASSLIAACGQNRVGAIEEAGSPVVGAPNPEDPFGYCYFEPTDEGEGGGGPTSPGLFYMKPSSEEAFSCTGHGEAYVAGQQTCVTHATPVFPCDTDADCPSPISGTSQVVCLGHHCTLPCNDGETCPDGLTCDDAWIYDGATGAPLPTPKLCMSVVEHPCLGQ